VTGYPEVGAEVVIRTGTSLFAARAQLAGQRGTVVAVDEGDQWPVVVELESGHLWTFAVDELDEPAG
jgi:hypothetical protein